MNLLTLASLLALAKSIYYLILYVTGYDLSIKKERKSNGKPGFTYFGAVNTLTPFGKTAING